MKNVITYLKTLWGAWGNLLSNDVRHDRRLTRGVLCFLGKLARRIYSFGCSQDILGAPQSLHSSPSGLNAKRKQKGKMEQKGKMSTSCLLLNSYLPLTCPLFASLSLVSRQSDLDTYAAGKTNNASGARVAREWLKYAAMLVMLLTLGSGNAWGITTSDLETSAATTLTDGSTYVVATAYNGTYLTTGVSSGWGTASTSIGSAAIFTAHGSKSGFYLTCSAGRLVPAASKTFSAYDTGTSNNLSLSASGEIQNSSNTLWKLRLNTNFRWYSKTTGSAVYLFKIKSATPTVTPDPTSLDWGTVLQGSSQSTKTISISGSNLTAGSLTISATGGYSVTPTSKGVSGTLSATTLTVTPPSTATAGTKNGKVTISGGGLASNVEVNLTMTVQASHTVTWMVNGSEHATTQVVSGGHPVFPSVPSSCDAGKVFVGWTETNIGSSETDTPPTFITTATTISSDKTYYAVFAKKGDFIRVTGPSSLANGQLLVIVSNKYSTAITNGIGYTTAPTESSSKVTATDAMTWLLTGNSSSGWAISKIANGYLLGYASNPSSNSSTAATLASNNSCSTWGIGQNSSTSNVLYISNKSTATCALEASSSSANWVVYNSSSYSSNQYCALKVYASTLTKFVTSCCTPLGTINGSINVNTPTSVTLTWSAVSGAEKYQVKVPGSSSHDNWTDVNSTSVTVTKSCGTAYTAYFRAIDTNGSHCSEGPESTLAIPAVSYTVGYSVTNGSKTSGDATTCGPLTAVFSANSGYHLPDKAAITVTGASDFSWTKATGTLTITAGQITGNINISFTCPADACTDAFSLHTGTKGGSDWLHNKCFSDADWGAVDDAIWVGEFPSTNECYVGYAGGDSYHGAYWAVGGIKTYNIPNGRTLGWNGSDYYSDYPATALGTFHIYKNSTDANYYLRFKPTTYVLRTGANSTWTSRDMTVSGINSNYYESDFVTLTSTLISEHAYVDLKANNGDGHVWCNFSNDRTASGNVKVKNGASTFRATDLQASDNGTYGKFQIDITQDVDNWKLAFVPYYRITYNANGGSGSTAASSYVEVGSTAAAAANGFTAPTGKQFGGWATSAGGSKAYDPTDAVTLNSNVELFAVWTDINYTVTVNQNPSVGATTTGQTTTAHYNGTINLTTTVPSGYRFVNWTTSDGFSITNPTSATTASFTMPAKNVTVTANFQQTHSITWMVNGASYSTGDPDVVVDHGGSISNLPTAPSAPTGCPDKVFMGWSEKNSGTTAKDDSYYDDLFKTTAPSPINSDKIFYAVFADKDDSGGSATTTITDASSWTKKGTSGGGTAGSTGLGTIVIGDVVTLNIQKCYVSTGDIRIYKNEDVTFETATSSQKITYIRFNTMSTAGSSYQAQNLQAWIDDGLGNNINDPNGSKKYNSSTTKWDYVWDNSTGANSVLLTASERTDLSSITISYTSTSYDNYVTLCSTCTTPSDLAVSEITSTGGKVTWNGVSLTPSEGFKVAWSTSSTRPATLNASNSADVAAATNEYTISGLTPATRYYVWVQSKCNSEWSSSADFYTNAKITYAAGTGASGSMDPKEVTYNTDATVDACTFTAPDGKTFNGWTSNVAVTVGGGSTTSIAGGATISNLTAAITLTAQWRDLSTWDITFTADNGTIVGGKSQTATENSAFTFPDVTSTTCGTFIGWITSSSYESTTKPASFKAAGATEDIALGGSPAATHYYAVYAEETDQEPTQDYVLIENEQDDWSGQYLIVSEYNDGTARTRAFNGSLSTLDVTSNYQDVTISSKKITSNTTTDSYAFTIAKIDGQPGKYSIRSASGKYMGYGSASNGLTQNDATPYQNTITYNTENSRIHILGSHATTPSRLAFNSSSTPTVQMRFRYFSSPDSQKDIQLYKKGGGKTYTYKTSPACAPTLQVDATALTEMTYVYNAGPSASQTFTAGGKNMTEGKTITVTAPTNFQLSKDNSVWSNSVSYTVPASGEVSSTIYIHLSAGLNVGSYGGVGQVITVSTNQDAVDNETSGNVSGSVTKAAATMAFTPDVYEATYEGSPVIINFMLTLNGDGTVAYSRSPAAGSRTVNMDGENTFTALQAGIWTITATHTPGDNYTKAANATATVRVKCVDTYVDFIHNKAVLTYGSGTPVTDGKMEDWGSGYTVPYVADESEATSGSCQTTHFKFVGWVSEDEINIVEGTFKPGYTLISAGTAGKTASTKTYYAVWAKLED